MPKGAGYYGQFLKCSSPSNPVATFYSSSNRPFSAPASPKAVFPEFAAVYDSTISPVLSPQMQKSGPSWATGFSAGDRPSTREKLRSYRPTSQPYYSRTKTTARTAQRGTLIRPGDIYPAVGYKPKPVQRPRGQVYAHHPHWVGC